MKKIIIIFFALFISSTLFAYSISKDYDGYVWDYEILATNESCSYIDDGTEKYYDTVLIRDSKSKINYVFYCSDENACLTKYYELINKYKYSNEIRDKLIPELQPLVKEFSTSKDGTWMFCRLSEYIKNDYSKITNEDLLDLIYERCCSDSFEDEELFMFIFSLHNIFNEFISLCWDEIETEEDRMGYYEIFLLPQIEILSNENNSEKIENIKNAFMDLLEIDPLKFEQYKNKTSDE